MNMKTDNSTTTNNNITLTYLNNLYCRLIPSEQSLSHKLYDYFSEAIPGSHFMRKNSKFGGWDGKKHYYSRQTGRFPIGLLPDLMKFIARNGIEIQKTNSYSYIRPSLTNITVDFLDGISLRDYQIEAIKESIKRPFGIIKSATGSGKTECMCGIAKSYSNAKQILILVNKKDLVVQTRNRMVKRGITDIGVYYGEERDPNKRIVVATVQSIVRPETYYDKSGKKKTRHIITCPELLDRTEVIFVDECKHEGANSFLHILEQSKASVRYGFDATPFEHNNRYNELEIKKHLGSIIFNLDTTTLIDQGVLTKPKIKMISIKSNVPLGSDYHQSYDTGIVYNETRNNVIKFIAESKKGRNLILINKIAQGEILNSTISNSLFLHGGSTHRTEVIDAFNNSKDAILIGSTIFDEAIDFSKGIDCLIIASAGRNFRRTIQRLGRALRKNNKGYVEVFDFIDKGNKYLRRHSTLRKKYYEIEGHDVTVVERNQ